MSAETWQAVRAEVSSYEQKSAALALALQIEKESLAATEGATVKLNEGEGHGCLNGGRNARRHLSAPLSACSSTSSASREVGHGTTHEGGRRAQGGSTRQGGTLAQAGGCWHMRWYLAAAGNAAAIGQHSYIN